MAGTGSADVSPIFPHSSLPVSSILPQARATVPRGVPSARQEANAAVSASRSSSESVTGETRSITTPAPSPSGGVTLRCIQLCLPEFPSGTEPHLPTAGTCSRTSFGDGPPSPVSHTHAPTGVPWDHHPNKLLALKSLFPSLPLGRETHLKTLGPRRVVESNTAILGFWNLTLR